ncbi:hypothetical protein CTA1_12670, partial [Colletotrichum tanaceti]
SSSPRLLPLAFRPTTSPRRRGLYWRDILPLRHVLRILSNWLWRGLKQGQRVQFCPPTLHLADSDIDKKCPAGRQAYRLNTPSSLAVPSTLRHPTQDRHHHFSPTSVSSIPCARPPSFLTTQTLRASDR